MERKRRRGLKGLKGLGLSLKRNNRRREKRGLKDLGLSLHRHKLLKCRLGHNVLVYLWLLFINILGNIDTPSSIFYLAYILLSITTYYI